MSFHVLIRLGLAATACHGLTVEAAPAETGSLHRPAVVLTRDAVDKSAGDVACYKIETPAATYFLEKIGFGLSSMVDRDGHDWIGFSTAKGTRARGNYRGFPNAVFKEAGNYFHPRWDGTDPSISRVDYAGEDRVTISADSENGLWGCRFDFFPTHCTFTMTRMPPDHRYWVLYEGTPGGEYEDSDWWIASGDLKRHPMTENREGDLPAPEWIAFGDSKLARTLFLLHHEDDEQPDHFYQMEHAMTVFGFGRAGMKKFLTTVPQSFSIGFLETTEPAAIETRMRELVASPSPAASAPLPALFVHGIVDEAGPLSIWGKCAGDLNCDGRVDLLAGGWRGGGLVWYENPGWKKHVVDPAAKISTDIEVADIDRDGKLDVVAVTSSGVIWYRNPDWKAHVVAKDTVHDIEVADFDGDGDIDIIARNQNLSRGASGATLFIYRQESPDTWTRSTQAIPDGEGIAAADIDGDGDLDIVINGTWFENRGDLTADWPAHVFGPEWKQDKVFVATGDLNGDGRVDIILSPSEPKGRRYRLSWFEAPANPKLGAWIEHVIEPDIEAVQHFAGIADFNLDGQPDIAVAAMLQGDAPQNVAIYLNGGKGAHWTKQVIGTTGSHSMRIVDLDGDGTPSLFGANHQDRKVELWRNTTRAARHLQGSRHDQR